MLFTKKIPLLILFAILPIAFLPVHAENHSKASQEDPFSIGEDIDFDQDISKIFSPNNFDSDFTNDNRQQDQFKSCPTAKIIALNKITAKSKEISLKIGEPQYFGNIEIKVHQCLKSIDLYLPNNNILLTVTEQKIDEDPTAIFQGWLISSNISVSTFEHPVYEIFARDCL